MRIGDIFFYFLACTLYWWWSANFSFFGISPDFVFIAAFSASVIAGPFKGLLMSFLLGLFMDAYSWGAFGLYAFFYSLLSYGVYRLKFKIDLTSSFSRVISCLILNYIFLAAYQFVSFMIFKNSVVLYKIMLFQPVFTAVFLELTFGFVYRIKERNRFWL
ncbi:MAG: rod shape-determining protein MreD [Elusimicrobia bacterium CG08_land_8_20_14_0_20_51_18]|nr:MAG: rod shape-determining protein MreD [Elusimicrobia bacterium CG08_land_8_20_14_0_20_51_18]